MSAEYLIARLETATQGSAELDARVIAYLVGGEAMESPVNGRWCVYVGTDRRGQPKVWEPRGEFQSALYRSVVDRGGPTRSIDTAIMLLPEGFAVCDFMIWPGQPSALEVYATHKEPDGSYWHGDDEGIWEAQAATPALALCAGALKARAAIERPDAAPATERQGR